MNNFLSEEYNDLCLSLERFHEIFGTLWRICRPRFSNEVPTAAVGFNEAGNCIEFLINKEFWESISDYTREFVICHEMSHIILSHGIRMKNYSDKYSTEVLNTALDLAVNHLLVSNFGFNKFHIDNWEKLVWCDTVFKELELEPNKSFEYYLSKIEEICQKSPSTKFQIIGGNHKYLEDFDYNINNKIKDTVNEINKKLTDEELNELKGTGPTGGMNPGLGRGIGESDIFSIYTGTSLKIKKIKEWDSVLDKYILKAEKERETSQWARLNRRIALLSNNLLLPSDMEQIDKGIYKYKIWLFLDYSGSCHKLKNIFFAASKTFDPKKFEVKKFAHTTEVGEFDKKDQCKVYGGGTSFSCIENYIQQQIQEKKIKNYPDAIFHMTDGDGGHVHAEYPERWYVFLSKSYYGDENYFRGNFNKGTNIFKLRDFIKEDI